MSLLSFGKNDVVADEKKAKVDLSAPWIGYARKIYALFRKDPDITIEYDADAPEVKLRVSDAAKAQALAELLPVEKEFGNVVLAVTVVPPNVQGKASLLAAAFEGNPIFSEVVHIGDIFANPISYVVFEDDVVQYFNDDLSSVDGVKSTLYEDLARDILDVGEGVLFCTKTYELEKIVWP